jgi:hypothetical protein
MFQTAGNRIAMSVAGNTRLDLENINTILTNPTTSGGGTTTILGSGVVGKHALILSNAPSNLANNPTTLELYYNKSIPGVNNDQLAKISFQGEDNAGTTSSGNMTIGNASSVAGSVLTLATRDNVAGSGAGLVLTGNTLLNATAGGNSGQHLCLTIGGTVYKIALLNA